MKKDLCFRQLFLHVFYYDSLAVSFCLLVRSFVLAFCFVFDCLLGVGGGGGPYCV